MLKIPFYWIICLLLLAGNYSMAGENIWTTGGPPGGSVKTIAVHPFDPQIIYVGTIQNGIYRTTDGGLSWVRLPSEGMETCMRVVAVHPVGPDTLYGATIHGVYKSTNTGQTWALLYPPHEEYQEYRAFAINPSNPDVLIAKDWKSTDSGESWYGMIGIDNGMSIEDFAIDPVDPGIIYCATGGMEFSMGVMKSTDMGDNWFSIHNNLPRRGYGQGITVDANDHNILYFAYSTVFEGRQDCLSKSTDGGLNWFDITPPNLTQPEIAKVFISPQNNNFIFAYSGADGLLLSADGGTHWNSVNNGLPLTAVADMEAEITGDGLLLGTYYSGLFRSTDLGDNWHMISNLPLMDCADLAVSESEPSNVLASGVDGLFQSSDYGQTWQHLDAGLPQTTPPAAVGIDKYLPQNYYVATYPWTSNSGADAGFYRSTDRGVSWEFVSQGLPPNNNYISMDLSYGIDGGRRIFLASYSGLYFSDSLGDNWNLCEGGLPANAFSLVRVAPGNPDIIAAGDYGNNIYISSDRGITWSLTTALPYVNWSYILDIAFEEINSSHLIASSYLVGLFESTDLGQNWTSILNDLPVNPNYTEPWIGAIAINPLNPANIFVNPGEIGICQTHNGGQHWELYNPGLDTIIYATRLKFAPQDSSRLILATGGKSVWTIHRTETGIEDNGVPQPREIFLSCYPNPFNSETKLNFETSPKSSIAIFDLMGKEVRKFNDLKAGKGSVVWDGTNAAGQRVVSGIYFARLCTAGAEKSVKITLLK